MYNTIFCAQSIAIYLSFIPLDGKPSLYNEIRGTMAKVQVQQFLWHRPNRPFVHSNGAIQLPPKGRSLPYNPRQALPLSRGKARTVATLWGKFVEVVRQVELDQEALLRPSSAGIARILEWSSEFGLLGILPSRARKIALSPIYQALNLGGVRSSVGMLQRTYWQPAPGVWVTKHNPVEVSTPIPRQNLGKIVHKTAWPKNRFQEPGCDLFAWEDLSGPEFRDPVSLQSFFFPLPAAEQFPQPLATEFWPIYREPIDQWMLSALAFKNAAMTASRYASDRFSQASLGDAEVERANSALWILNSLAAAVAPIYEFGSHALKQRDCSGSLLSILAKMFFEDLLVGFRCRHCDQCKAIFVSKDRKASYCSERCRNTAAVGRYRAKLSLTQG
jgi:hypothetical protein